MLKFECKMIKEDWSKCPDLSEGGVGINKNIEIWRQSWESIKMLKFEC